MGSPLCVVQVPEDRELLRLTMKGIFIGFSKSRSPLHSASLSLLTPNLLTEIRQAGQSQQEEVTVFTSTHPQL